MELGYVAGVLGAACVEPARHERCAFSFREMRHAELLPLCPIERTLDDTIGGFRPDPEPDRIDIVRQGLRGPIGVLGIRYDRAQAVRFIWLELN